MIFIETDWRFERVKRKWATSNHYGPHGLGYTHDTMGGTMSSNGASLSKSFKTPRSSDCSLKLENMKLESQVIGDQRAPVN